MEKNGDTQRLHCQVTVPNSATEQTVEHYNVQPAVMAGFTLQRVLVLSAKLWLTWQILKCSSMRQLITGGGVQTLHCARGHLSGSVAVKHPIQVNNIRGGTQKALWHPICATRASRLKMHLWKSYWNRISNHLAMRFEFRWLLAVQTS